MLVRRRQKEEEEEEEEEVREEAKTKHNGMCIVGGVYKERALASLRDHLHGE